MSIGYDFYNSPIGVIHVVVDEIGVKKIELFEEDWQEYIKLNPEIKLNKQTCKEVVNQLHDYFQGKRKDFNLPLSIEGTDFRRRVWSELQAIPYGETRNYLQIAEAVGNPKALRAIGQANKANKLPIIIPCHRVIGKSGKLVGYAGDRTYIKRLLLEHEGIKLDK